MSGVTDAILKRMESSEQIAKQLTEARAELRDLENDLPTLQELLERHDRAVRQATKTSAPIDKRMDVAAKRTAAKDMLEQHKTDLAEARERVERLAGELERAKNRERHAELVPQLPEAEQAWRDQALKSGRQIRAALEALVEAEYRVSDVWEALSALPTGEGLELPDPPRLSLFKELEQDPAFGLRRQSSTGEGSGGLVRFTVGHYSCRLHADIGREGEFKVGPKLTFNRRPTRQEAK